MKRDLQKIREDYLDLQRRNSIDEKQISITIDALNFYEQFVSETGFDAFSMVSLQEYAKYLKIIDRKPEILFKENFQAAVGRTEEFWNEIMDVYHWSNKEMDALQKKASRRKPKTTKQEGSKSGW